MLAVLVLMISLMPIQDSSSAKKEPVSQQTVTNIGMIKTTSKQMQN